MPRKLNEAAEKLIKDSEGLALFPYLDSAGLATIGVGHLIIDGGRKLEGAKGMARARELYPNGITYEQAIALFEQDIAPRLAFIEGVITHPVNDNQFGALFSLMFNVGAGAFAKSTLLKYVNAGQFDEAAGQFEKWCRAGGKFVPGLLERRKREKALFLTPTGDA